MYTNCIAHQYNYWIRSGREYVNFIPHKNYVDICFTDTPHPNAGLSCKRDDTDDLYRFEDVINRFAKSKIMFVVRKTDYLN